MALTDEELANLRASLRAWKEQNERELAENKCQYCGGPLTAFWKNGVVDAADEDAVIFRCVPCLDKEQNE
jgi:hypothetical protein